MAILMRPLRSPRALRRLLLVGLAFSASGCLVLQQMGWMGTEPGFSHRLHVVEEEMECLDCHLYYEDEDEPGMPRLGGCMLCHDDIDPDAPPELRAEAFFVDGEFAAASVTALDDEVIFSHLDHVTDEDGCADCHGEVAGSEGVPADWMAVDMEACVDCHAETGYSTECTACHQELTTETAPASHDGAWDRQHGLRVRGGACPEQTADRCDICHTESSCVACHKEQPPANHNNFWRRRAHGLTARMDRDNCAACHEPDSCDRCHSSAVPQSHNSLWGGFKNTHCLGCHISGGENTCAMCHQAGTPSHSLAPPKPPGHNPASDCRECHMIIIHVDDGGDCNQCHF